MHVGLLRWTATAKYSLLRRRSSARQLCALLSSSTHDPHRASPCGHMLEWCGTYPLGRALMLGFKLALVGSRPSSAPRCAGSPPLRRLLVEPRCLASSSPWWASGPRRRLGAPARRLFDASCAATLSDPSSGITTVLIQMPAKLTQRPRLSAACRFSFPGKSRQKRDFAMALLVESPC